MNASAEPVCPWTRLSEVAALAVHPHAGPLGGRFTLSGSKSVSNRALLMAALADGPCVLSGVLRSDDTWWMAESLRCLGALLEIEDTTFRIDGRGFLEGSAPAEIYVGSAGTAARFLPGVLAARQGPVTIRASAQMTKRPVGALVQALRQMGAAVDATGPEMRLPLRVGGGGFEGGEITLSGGQSSQFISGALIAAPLARRGLRLVVPDEIVQSDYVRITIRCMEQFGVRVVCDEAFRVFTVAPQRYRAADMALEADASTATYFFALAAVTGGVTEVLNLGTTTTQPDYGFVDLLERMGCAVTRTETTTRVEGPARLKGGFDVDMKPMSDATLTLAALAPFADAPIHIHNVAHIRHHESDRVAVACGILESMGVKVEERPDGLSVYPGAMPRPVTLDPHDDHRVAMAMALTGLKAGGVTILNPSCVSKTCPDYFDRLAAGGVVCAAANAG